MSQSADQLLQELRHPHDDVIRAVRGVILSADKSVKEGVKWNAPSYYTSEHFATFHLRGKSGVQLVLHLGVKARPDADMPSHVSDPGKLLTWKGADRALLHFADVAQVERDRTAVLAILKQWLLHVAV
ncbi:MAG TPA: DUF1801 domain-containing protein [Gemmatimonas sp.]|uniref:DUF1801 domain-containing protein n=1 Tax=Gemmatimonas sp. TaxID=1962908 RepID=UPI002ED8C5D3